MEERKDKIDENRIDPSVRINKYLSQAGLCSRREADRLVEAGRVTINGRTALPGEKVKPEDEVRLDGESAAEEERKVLLLFHKPRGVVCSTKKQRSETTVVEYLNYPVRVYPVGRLDRDSQGLLLMTNQGELVNRILRGRYYHEKEYLVEVDRPVDDDFIAGMRGGVPILDTMTRPCFAEATGQRSFRIILTQGLNRQIRRMCEYFGYRVVSLKRIRIMNLSLEGIPEGGFREITPGEREELERMLEYSDSKMQKGRLEKPEGIRRNTRASQLRNREKGRLEKPEGIGRNAGASQPQNTEKGCPEKPKGIGRNAGGNAGASPRRAFDRERKES